MNEDKTNKERIEQIHTMLMEFASGNFAYKLERSNLDDDIEALTALVNMTFEEIKDSFLHQGYANQSETYKHLIQMFFVLDVEGTIVAFNSRIKQMLFFDDNELQGNPFSTFLTQNSKLAWNDLKSKLVSTNLDAYEEFIMLSFKTKQNLILTTNCLASLFNDRTNKSERIVITSIEIIKNRIERENLNSGMGISETAGEAPNNSKKNKQLNLSFSDIRKIRNVHNHIVNNLDKQLSPLIELAHTFGTNEYKLKYGFKQLYGQTVFRFLIDERLRKASILIQHTDTSIKEVAHVTGFVSAPHFSKVFKEKYGFTPRDLRKQSNRNLK
ncbi:helix-turn-helix domain-containing protein [Flavivirga jejuensis]|uniref:Helix-turn-helix domain-containing protein n=1 Tax=Flavivirga jejuensis TaxID=870487 RepID=A0ABT8WMH5_9FLAO|nr:helix-turn-helix domain-containing protein [Flavivirga jejuensis]MDO5974354.1 helix-turn-helix domain-containing protein [Flavivirga jejuensis]